MVKISSRGIDSQYNLIRMLLVEPEKYKKSIATIRREIAYMPIKLKNKLEQQKHYL